MSVSSPTSRPRTSGMGMGSVQVAWSATFPLPSSPPVSALAGVGCLPCTGTGGVTECDVSAGAARSRGMLSQKLTSLRSSSSTRSSLSSSRMFVSSSGVRLLRAHFTTFPTCVTGMWHSTWGAKGATLA
eukprot:4116162-Pyramimonas_sp.AAC.1